ncbi:MAG: sugar transferase [Muribaculaceae bacterium]|nr:sugar transferase [Muribaculaceae bacterium]
MNRRPATEWQQRLKYVVSDLLSSSVAFFLFDIFRYEILHGQYVMGESLSAFLSEPKVVWEQVVMPVLMLCVYWLSGYYNRPFGKSRLEELISTVFSALFNTAWIYLVILINDLTGLRRINYELILVLFGVLTVCTYMGRLTITSIARRHFRRNEWRFRTLFIGSSAEARKAARSLENDSFREGYSIIGFIPVEGEDNIIDSLTLPPDTDIMEFCRDRKIDQVVIALKKRDDRRVLNILYHLFPLDLPIKIAPDTMSFLTSSIRLKDIYGEPLVDLTSPALTESARNVKRVCDVIISVLALAVLSPVMLWTMIRVRTGSKGPVFYSQERVGRHQKPFRIYKFRTMYEDAENGTPRLTTDGDSRVTPVGRILRKYRIDEIPQFWNVLKGDMSIVGPRPERAYFIERIVEKAPYYALVYQVRPGITSWGMVKYGYASNVQQMVERTRYDLIYLSNMSLFIDIKILIYTLRTLFRGEGK